MKTNLLKWDTRIQLLFAAVTALFFVYPPMWGYLLLLQMFLGAYEIFSNSIHLLLNHRSLGFRQERFVLLAASLVCVLAMLGALVLLFQSDADTSRLLPSLNLFELILLPLVLQGAYFLLCKRELNFLQTREFFILK